MQIRDHYRHASDLSPETQASTELHFSAANSTDSRTTTSLLGSWSCPTPHRTANPHHRFPAPIRTEGAPSSAKMPTPESAMFKAQKPKVPPTFDGVDYDDHKAYKAAQDAIIREQWVGAMMIRLVGEELGKCYMREGVNHLENCGHLRGEHTLAEDPLSLEDSLMRPIRVMYYRDLPS